MTTEVQQSAIAEVLDQMSVDYADGEYLNNVSSNIGLERPPLGFSDDSGRAITKTLGLRYKQIAQKFRDVLTIVFGPRVTVCGNVEEDTPAGVGSIVLNNVDAFPDLGTIILDQGLATEETLPYCFIDRGENRVWLEAATSFSHTAREDAAETLVLPASTGDTSLYLYDSQLFPTTFSATITLSPGTASEETVSITANDVDSGTITVSPAIVNDHVGPIPSEVQTGVAVAYVPTSEYLLLDDTSKFPPTGYIRLGKSASVLTATAGTTTALTCAPDTFTSGRLVGSIVVFTGNVTAALADVEALVVGATTNTLTFMTALGAAVAAGDTFSVRPTLKYVFNDYSENALQLERDVPNVEVPVGVEVELLRTKSLVHVSGAKVLGVAWDVIQSTPRLVELLIPAEIGDINTTRSAGYLHPEILSVSVPLTADVAIGDTSISVVNTAALPPAGAARIDSEYIGYTKDYLTSTYVLTGSTTTTLNTADSLFGSVPVGFSVFVEDPGAGVSFSRVVSGTTATSITFTNPVDSETFAALTDGITTIRVFSPTTLSLVTTAAASHLTGANVFYFESAHTGASALAEGNPLVVPNTWQGPYLYDLVSTAPASAGYVSSLSEVLAGPTALAVDCITGATAVEVLDASNFPLGSASPFNALLGRVTANRERINIDDVNLKSRTATTLAAAVTAGDSSLEVTALTGGGTADTFPDALGYRVLVSAGTVNEEILYVSGTDTGPDRLLVFPPAVNSHLIGADVELLADVLTVDPIDRDHQGRIRYTTRLTSKYPVGLTTTVTADRAVGDTSIPLGTTLAFPSPGTLLIDNEEYVYSLGPGSTVNILNPEGLRIAVSATQQVYVRQSFLTREMVEVEYDEIPLASTAGISADGGSVILNYGSGLIKRTSALGTALAPGDSAVVLADSSAFPVVYPYHLVIGEGTANEEYALVTNNDAATTLDINGSAYGVKNSHAAGVKVSMLQPLQEQLNYTSVDGSNLSFSVPIVLQSNHNPAETVIRASGKSQPGNDGYDYPFRMPTDIRFRLEFLINLIRAAGVQVSVIENR